MGKIETDHTGSGGGITLSSDGTSLLLDGTAVGGGGSPDLYAENPSSATAPSATGTNAVAIGFGALSSGLKSTSLGDATAGGNYSFAAQNGATANGLYSIAIGLNNLANFQYATAVGGGAQANATNASAFGYNSRGSGTSATALANSYASGTDSFAAAIANNTSSYGATGANSVAIGRNNKATATASSALGGYLAVSSANWSTTVGGRQNTADASYSVASGYGAVVDSIVGKVAHSSMVGFLPGDTQTGTLVLTTLTTDGTASSLRSNGSTAGTTNQVILRNNSAYSFSGTIIAREQASAGSDYASWEIKGALLRDANAASTVLGNGIQNKMYATSGASAWAIALTADTTNGGLKIEVTGAASTNIRWVATVNTSEVTY